MQSHSSSGRSMPLVVAAWILCIAILFVANGRWSTPAGAWLFPLMALLAIRTMHPAVGYLVLSVAISGVSMVTLKELAPLPGVGFYLYAVSQGLVSAAPFLLWRIASRRLPVVAAGLVLPCAWVTLEYVISIASPFGTWLNVAYTQFHDLSLVQTASITGIWGISFLVVWFGAAVVGAVSGPSRSTKGLLAWGLVLGSALLFGGIRLAATARPEDAVRIAGVSQPEVPLLDSGDDWGRLFGRSPLADETWESLGQRSRALHAELLARSQTQAQAGARIILWSEAAALVRADDETLLIDDGVTLARQESVYLAMTMFLVRRDDGLPFENKIVLIDPEGVVRWQYHKARPTPGMEMMLLQRGDGILPRAATPFGQVSAAICFDMDFPTLFHQPAARDATVLLCPAGDWEAIDPIHSHMAAFRSVEHGFSLFRQTQRGLSLAVDPYGRSVGAMDHFAADDMERVLVASVPVGNVATVYSTIGDLFAWLCVAATAAALVWIIVNK